MILRKDLKASVVRHEAKDYAVIELHRPRTSRLILIAILLLAAALGFWLKQTQGQHFREMMVRQQLWQIRNALVAYRARYKSAPADLATLASTTFSEPDSGKAVPLMEGIEFDRAGRMVDPLGYPYRYDPQLGTVFSTAPCCRSW